MNQLLRLGLAVVVGVLVTSLLEWLAPRVPGTIDVLVGVVAGFIAYRSFPVGPTPVI